MLFASLSFAFVIAQAKPDARDIGMWWLIAAGVIGTISNVVLAMAAWRRKPPVAEMVQQQVAQVHAHFATKEEVETIRTEAAASIRRVHERIDELTCELNRTHADSERARGTMFGKLEAITEQLHQLHNDIKESRP